MRFFYLILLSAFFVPATTRADGGKDYSALLKQFDSNSDQMLDLAEFTKAVKHLTAAGDVSAAKKLLSERQDVDSSDLKFLRIQRNKKGKPETLDTSILSFFSNDKRLQVDLIGAVHVADEPYYQQLNRLFTDYDVVLYELVAPEGTRIPKGGGGKPRHPVGQLQQTIKSMLDLSFQLNQIDYQKKNLVHADMSPDEFAQSMKDRNESFLKLFLRMMNQAAAQSKAGNTSDVDLLFALFSKNRSLKLKQIMADQFENLEGQMNILEGPDGSTLISERNKKALSVLKKQIRAGNKKIGIFYGAGHMSDMAERLINDFKLKPESEKWLTAWNMAK